MRLFPLIFTIGLLSILSSCGHMREKDYNDTSGMLYDITSRTDISEGFSDIFLSITSETKTDSSHIYIGKELYKNTTVGLKFEVKSNLPAGITSKGELDIEGGISRNAIKFLSIGRASDNLVFALAQLYDEPANNIFTKEILTPSLFSLNQQDVHLDKPGYYKFKLFFNDDSEDNDRYAEMFFNINTSERIVELHEKDNDYRRPLLNTFTTQ